jgi:hypothetical protein
MEVTKLGKVLFDNGKVVEIYDFEIKNGTLKDLEDWVLKHFQYIDQNEDAK